jgi:hypothetical protein
MSRFLILDSEVRTVSSNEGAKVGHASNYLISDDPRIKYSIFLPSGYSGYWLLATRTSEIIPRCRQSSTCESITRGFSSILDE